MSAKVSVLVPMYNHGHYIRATLNSVAQQSWTNFECIVMDDGSTDCGAKIVEEFVARDNRFRLLSQPNAGLVAALNALSEVASGDFVTTLDADDCFVANRLEVGIRDLEENPNLAVSFCGVQTIDGMGNLTNVRSELYRGPLEGEEFYRKLVCHNFLASCAGLIRRKHLADVGRFARPVGLTPDWDLWLRLACCGDLVLRGEVGVLVRWDGHNMSSQNIRESAAQMIAISRQFAYRVCERHNLHPSVKASIADMRIWWAQCIDDAPEVLRSMAEKRNFARLSESDWALFVRVMLSRGHATQARRYLRELTSGRLVHEVTSDTRTRMKKMLNRLEEIDGQPSSESGQNAG